MVAYSFRKMFVPQLEQGLKNHTVRADRKRHARPGEAVQIYYAMRTKQCRKLRDPDPVCTKVAVIEIEVTKDKENPISAIAIDGRILDDMEMNAFAISDGFGLDYHQVPSDGWSPDETALTLMGKFWLDEYGPKTFTGCVIYWSGI